MLCDKSPIYYGPTSLYPRGTFYPSRCCPLYVCDLQYVWNALTCIRPDKFPDLIVDGVQSADWEYVRLTWNHYTSEPVSLIPE